MGRRQIVKRFLTEANLFLNYSVLKNFTNVVLICFFTAQIFVFCHTLKICVSFCPTLWWWNKTRNIYVVFCACTSSPTTKPSGSFPCSMTARYSNVLTDSDESNPCSHATSFGEADNSCRSIVLFPFGLWNTKIVVTNPFLHMNKCSFCVFEL
jgi:hypothetical protein